MSSAERPTSAARIPLVGSPGHVPDPLPSTLSVEEESVASLELGSAFELASAELGFAAAAWLFVDEVAAFGGDGFVAGLREDLGTSFSVLDVVAGLWLNGVRPRAIDTSAIRGALEGTRRLLVVGIESRHLDALVEDLPKDTRIGLLSYRLQRVDWERVLSNYEGRVEAVDVAEFQGWAGARSTILTFAYGVRDERVHVLPAFLRVAGPDVRTQFRDIIGWDVLGSPPEVYPRRLVETTTSELTCIVGPKGDSEDAWRP
jgi:hypothetical protein